MKTTQPCSPLLLQIHRSNFLPLRPWRAFLAAVLLALPLQIAAQPVISEPPQSQTVVAGSTITFKVKASGDGDLTYQWTFKGADLGDGGGVAGAKTATMTVANVRATDEGPYTVVVTDANGESIESDPATLTVVVAPTVSTPESQSLAVGATASFSVVASGTGPFSYQWQFKNENLTDGGAISGATSAMLKIGNITKDHAGEYRVIVTANGLSVTSGAAVLTVNDSSQSWTIMVYGHADHNLSQSLIYDMREMEQVGSSAGFNIVVQADFDASTANNGLPKALASGVSRFLIQKSSDPNNITSVPVERLPELNMDDPANLVNFIKWAAAKYPASRYGLVMWDHGGQWQGFGGDGQDNTLTDKGGLSTVQIRQAVSAGGIAKWDFITFDTCLMGGAEVLPDFVPLTDVFIACPEIDYGPGWDYTASLGFLKANSSISALDFARQEAKDWSAHHLRPGREADLALASHAVYDLTKFTSFSAALNAFGGALKNAATPQNLALPEARLNTSEYSISDIKDIGKPTDYADLGEFADKLVSQATTDNSLKSTAQSLVASIDAMVVAKVVGSKKQATHGLSVYFPRTGVDSQAYSQLTLSSQAGATWPQVLLAISENKAADTTPPRNKAGTDQSGGSVTALSVSARATSVSASVQQPAYLSFSVIEGPDAYRMGIAVVDNHFTGQTNQFVYLGQIADQQVHGVGNYSNLWNGTLPALSSSAGTNKVLLGAFYEDTGSDILVSFARYFPPGETDYDEVILLIQLRGDSAQVIAALDGEAESLAPEGIDLEPLGILTPSYYFETRMGTNVDQWISGEILAKSSVTIPANGIDGLRVTFESLPTGTYRAELQVEDFFGNESDVLEYDVAVGAASALRITLTRLSDGKVRIAWPAAAANTVLQSTTNVAAGPWTDESASQITSDGTNKIFTASPTGSVRFYRLKQN